MNPYFDASGKPFDIAGQCADVFLGERIALADARARGWTDYDVERDIDDLVEHSMEIGEVLIAEGLINIPALVAASEAQILSRQIANGVKV